MGPKQILLCLKVDQRVIAMKRYSILPKDPVLDLHCWMQFNVIPKTLIGRKRDLAPLQRCIWRILQQANRAENVLENFPRIQ